MFSTILPNDTSQLTRRSHKKAKTGCTKCKERKLKCDEAKPICLNCTRHFLVPQPCNYPQDMPSRKRKSPSSDSSRVSSRTPEYDAVTKMYIRVSLPGALSAEMIDPFETYPETNVKEVDIFIKYYLQNAVYTCFPWQPKSETNPTTNFFVPIIWGDTLLFHTILQFSAMRLEKQQGQRRAATIELGRECIRLLKTRVEKEVVVSDQTISAVAMLAAIEHEKGNVRMMRMHMAGLSRMVDLVGGLNAIRERNPMIANSVFWTFTVAMYELPYPCFDPTLPEFYPADHNLSLVENARIYSHFQDFAPDLNNPTLASMQASDFNLTEPIATARYSIQHVSHLVPKHSTYPTASTSLVILTRICTILSHLQSIAPSAPLPASTDPQILMTESTRLALLLHIFIPWRGHPPDGTLTINHILHQLIANLKLLLTETSPNFDRVLMLWILSVGGVAADGSPERRWFMSHLGDLTEDLGIQCWKEMKGNISSVVWHEILCENIHRRLWEEVKRKRDEVLELV
ncbi:C6 zinc finger domain-containing protein [Rutstroemia sp. NJR-2017a WRK4]|nr:C6 zinc finger domain-containing protein [Rutstroemia sp. NJR-2017a WRK4]